ncbi:MAG: ATP-binding protein [Alphaproteobacteria bacterium]
MIKRKIISECKISAKEFPVVTILGPRQSGKTTLAKMVFHKKKYCSLEYPDVREFAIADPRGFLNKYPEGAILDEIQRCPLLLSYIQGIVDEKQKNGMFILTGSHQQELHNSITQSLAGRTAILTLYPLELEEIPKQKLSKNFFQQIQTGFFPVLFSKNIRTLTFYRNYLKTYVERDVRQLINLKDLSVFQKFLKLLAGRSGQLINYNNLANDIGVSSTTIKHWISILEASYLIYVLKPYYKNFRKRIVKSPKIYFTDTGLACYLLGIKNAEMLERDPLRGNLFENAVVVDILKQLMNTGLDDFLYFFRDSNGNEVDLLYANGRNIIPIEIKSSETFNSNFLKGINYFSDINNLNIKESYIIYAGAREQKIKNTNVVSVYNLKNIFRYIFFTKS